MLWHISNCKGLACPHVWREDPLPPFLMTPPPLLMTPIGLRCLPAFIKPPSFSSRRSLLINIFPIAIVWINDVLHWLVYFVKFGAMSWIHWFLPSDPCLFQPSNEVSWDLLGFISGPGSQWWVKFPVLWHRLLSIVGHGKDVILLLLSTRVLVLASFNFVVWPFDDLYERTDDL